MIEWLIGSKNKERIKNSSNKLTNFNTIMTIIALIIHALNSIIIILNGRLNLKYDTTQ